MTDCNFTDGKLNSVCDAPLVDAHMSKVLTQYRQSQKLLTLLAGLIASLEPIKENLCLNLYWKTLDLSTGEQLDFYGALVGMPRCVCDAKQRTFFGFSNASCVDDPCGCLNPIGGFCDDFKCSDNVETGIGEYCFTDDDLYRRFIKGKILSNASDGSTHSIIEVANAIFDSTSSFIASNVHSLVTVGLDRPFTTEEFELLPLIEKIIPTYPSTKVQFSHSNGKPFGFGAGWGEFCSGGFRVVCNKKTIKEELDVNFGFCGDAELNQHNTLKDGWALNNIGGFCQASFTCTDD